MRCRIIKFLLCGIAMVLLSSACQDKEVHKSSDTISSRVQTVGNSEESTAEPTIEPTAQATTEPTIEPTPFYKKVVLGFGGDINLDDSIPVMVNYKASQNNIEDCISPDLIDIMKEVDIMMLNNEFAYSDRGTKASNKEYTFRSDPENVSILNELGVDIVSLANNHTLDYGLDALMDTFQTLDDAKVQYVGAGINSKRAARSIDFVVNGKKIAYIAASKVIPTNDWVATSKQAGMLSTWDADFMKQTIAEVAEKNDFVVVYLHWGVENSTEAQAYQREWARMYMDAGADAIIGCHPHVVQGVEFYKGKPIIYSLGNYWFSSYTRESMLIQLEINEDNSANVNLVPVMLKDRKTYLITNKNEKKSYYDYLQSLSFGVTIEENGMVNDN